MIDEEILSILMEMRQEHNFDRDGGYAFLRDVVQLSRRQNEDNRRRLHSVLLDMVVNLRHRMWGVALEALAQDPAPEAVTGLEAALVFDGRPVEWIDDVIRVLMQLRSQRVWNLAKDYIYTSIRKKRNGVLLLIAHLYWVEPDFSIEISAHTFAEWLLIPEKASVVSHYITAFVSIILAVDETGLIRLIEETYRLDQEAGRILTYQVIDELSKPWNRRDYGEARVEALIAKIRSVGH